MRPRCLAGKFSYSDIPLYGNRVKTLCVYPAIGEKQIATTQTNFVRRAEIIAALPELVSRPLNQTHLLDN